ncbi:DivIVA domain-containing protein [Micromonospora sp. WMMD1102]|uniref:DivIVA domain-containing protein n=1 Tax=Micromonospora sp. WMMD1102 TaxID=3016105 RepID=UPI0024155FCF|nr:DivIVA domain-containing protein [Micromonospora sp. WMMD1102]MDG4785687.1 DivIVA domain-containing protein [Micromonospora sp. WMMD1102]MDG4792160.1 DivIVA domain-containing protein [Micromonospora sp. WMMD1102]
MLLRRLFRRYRRPPRQLGQAYRSATYRPLLPSQVRMRRFTRVGFARRGVDPAEVAAFLDQVAGDLARAYNELATVREQNARIKDALRRWQSRQSTTAHRLADR